MLTSLTASSRVGLFLLLSCLMPSLAHARTCNSAADWNPHGYIGEKWQAFNGPDSSLGCPRGPEENYTPGLAATGLSYANGARQQDFEHGTIVWFPSLGQKMLFSVWWNGADKIHVEFTGIDQSRPHFRIGLSDGIHEQMVDFPAGTGHNRDLDVPYMTGVIVRLLPCEGTESSFTCAPHGKTTNGFFKEDANDGTIVPIISMQNTQNAGSYANNDSHAPPSASTQQARDNIGASTAQQMGGKAASPPPAADFYDYSSTQLNGVAIGFKTGDDDLDRDTVLTVSFTCGSHVVVSRSARADMWNVGWLDGNDSDWENSNFGNNRRFPGTGPRPMGSPGLPYISPADGTFILQMLPQTSPLSKSKIGNCTTTVHIDPNGRDHWVFDYELCLAFEDNSAACYAFNGHSLAQDNRENTYVLKDASSITPWFSSSVPK